MTDLVESSRFATLAEVPIALLAGGRSCYSL